jgi:hypothetical protein
VRGSCAKPATVRALCVCVSVPATAARAKVAPSTRVEPRRDAARRTIAKPNRMWILFPDPGDIHVLVVGDPGLGKSEMLKAVHKLAPRGIYVCGTTTSSSGLTVTLVRDSSGEFGLEVRTRGVKSFLLLQPHFSRSFAPPVSSRESRSFIALCCPPCACVLCFCGWRHANTQAGALVLGDQGVVCIDEFDKMGAEQQVSQFVRQSSLAGRWSASTTLAARDAVQVAVFCVQLSLSASSRFCRWR